jgi:hypothetical protein
MVGLGENPADLLGNNPVPVNPAAQMKMLHRMQNIQNQ